jgi:hypothetical protein
MRRPSFPQALILLFCVGGCASVRMPPLEFPAEKDVERVVIEPNRKVGTPATGRIIEDRQQVEKITRFLESLNNEWRKPRTTFPTPFYSVSLSTAGHADRVVWIGRDWIGTKEIEGARFRTMTPEAGRELRDMLGLPPEP